MPRSCGISLRPCAFALNILLIKFLLRPQAGRRKSPDFFKSFSRHAKKSNVISTEITEEKVFMIRVSEF